MIEEIPVGIFKCRDCARLTTFYFEGDRNNVDADLAECECCGFAFGKALDEYGSVDASGRRVTTVVQVLSDEVKEEGMRLYVEQGIEMRRNMGIPVFAPPRPVVREILRRRGEDFDNRVRPMKEPR